MIEGADKTVSVEEEKGCILIADDSKIVRVSAKKMLSAKFDLVFAEDGIEACEKAHTDKRIHVIFTDLRMPNLDGLGLIQRIRESSDERVRNLPIVAITGETRDDELKKNVLDLGATDFITKPFEQSELIARAEAHSRYRRDTTKLKENTYVDILTGTLNKEGLKRQLEKDLAFVNRHSEALSLVKFDLDNYKVLQEQIGKRLVDALVKQIAATLSKSVRKEDSVGRTGPGEFLVVLPTAKVEGVSLLAKRVCMAVKSSKIKIGDKNIQISMSAGIVAADKQAKPDINLLMRMADEALQKSKSADDSEVHILRLEAEQQDVAVDTVSIDQILTAIASDIPIGSLRLESAIKTLQPLFSLLNDEQRALLIQQIKN